MEKEKVETTKLETDQQERMFTQSEVNELIKKRLERVKEKMLILKNSIKSN